MTPRRMVAFAALLLLSAAGPLDARQVSSTEEVIESFDMTMSVEPGGSMRVTERIVVRARGNQIRRGIFRDFPTSFPRHFGLGRIEAPFEVVSVTRDGNTEPHRLEGIGDGFSRGGVRVRIGQANVMLDPGTYAYEIVYRTDRWVRFDDAEDQVYWNVTGSGWSFPILSASAEIYVDGLRSNPVLESWTGPEGATRMGATATWDAVSRIARFETTDALAVREGLTVRMTFPSGQLAEPSSEVRDQWFRADWGGYIDAGYLVLFVVSLYLLMWRRVGIDPAPGPTRLRTEPPAAYSPAELGYIEARGYGQAQLSAALVSLALKGAIRITNDETDWSLHKLVDEPEGLAPEEKQLFDRLLGKRQTIELERSHHMTLRPAIKAFRSSLRGRLESIYFENNRLWFFAGLTITVVGFGVLALKWGYAINPVAWFLALWLTIWTVATSTLAYRVIQMVKDARSSGSPVLLGSAGGMVLFALPFFIAEVVVFGILTVMVPTHLVLAAFALGVTNVVFYHLLERPTLKGRGVLDELAGFRSWLDGEQVGSVGGDRSVAVYESHLPYAIALGLADRWTEAFADELEPLMTAPQSSGPFPWYHHRGHSSSFSPRTFSSSLSSSLGGTLSSNSSPPGSSGGGGGGGGGGGSSGGGGGGGGGGGW